MYNLILYYLTFDPKQDLVITITWFSLTNEWTTQLTSYKSKNHCLVEFTYLLS